MSEVENFFRENKAAFDDAEPPSGHSNRFQERLTAKPESGMNPMFWLAAATIAAFLMITQVLSPIGPQQESTVAAASLSLSDISPEMAEVEQYFSEQIEVSEGVLLKESVAIPSKEEILRPHLERLEQSYAELQEELYKNKGDERIIKLMIENYRLRLTLLENHLEQVNNYKD